MVYKKPSTPKGTRDFGPKVLSKRNYLIKSIQSIFKKFSFLPLETPTMEKLDILAGRYGGEGEKLIFKVLNSGDYLTKIKTNIQKTTSSQLTPQIAEKGLRYDLTVPFARYVAMNHSKITFPFRRYQIQPVWRADRPQKGRYREFMQCDADMIGTDSLLCEAEIIMMINEILPALGIEGYEICINSRKILSALAEYLDHKDEEETLCVIMDKLDKIGIQGVFTELERSGYTKNQLDKLLPILELTGGSIAKKLNKLEEKIPNNKNLLLGLEELKQIVSYMQLMEGDLTTLNFTPSLARGLAYYTGTIFEVKLKDENIGSIAGGGRYDNLTEIFGLSNISGIGFSLGIDRIYDLMEKRNLFPNELLTTTQLLIINFGKEEEKEAVKKLALLRKSNILVELYPTAAKLKKQMSYANNQNIPYIALLGSDEVKNNILTVKNMSTGKQEALTLENLIYKLKRYE